MLARRRTAVRPAPAHQLVAPTEAEREPAEQLTLFARAGQLALPGHVAQLGLDGVAYAPPPYAPLEPRSGEPFLGTATPTFAARAEPAPDPAPPDPADYPRLLHASLFPPPPPRQLVLWPDTWERAPRQPTIWPTLDARLPLVPERQQKCQRTRFTAKSDVGLHRSATNRWRLSGVVSCGKNTCPSCGRRKARATSALLGVAFERHREMHPEGDHWMLTLAVPHVITDGVARSNAWLYDACNEFWRSTAWRSFAERWGIVARVRVYDAVHGGRNGTHPHFHCALFPSTARVAGSELWRIELEESGRSFQAERRRRKAERLRLRKNATRTEQRRREESDRDWEHA